MRDKWFWLGAESGGPNTFYYDAQNQRGEILANGGSYWIPGSLAGGSCVAASATTGSGPGGIVKFNVAAFTCGNMQAYFFFVFCFFLAF